MDDTEKISGKKIFNTLDQLKKDHTMLNIHVMGTDFDGLSIILGVSDGENPRFFIDYPVKTDFDSAFFEGKKCYFEFSDENRIKYSFKTTIDSVLGKRIKFYFPEVIERSQRRKSFRTPVPSGTRLIYRGKSNQFEFNVINISEGGVLASIKAKYHDKGIFFKGNKLRNLSILSGHKEMSAKIDIQSLEIIRLDKENEKSILFYGFKFINVDKRDQEVLKKFIYFCQRNELKKRGELDI